MKKYVQLLCILISIVSSATAMATDFFRHELKNRSAASLKLVLSELAGDDIKIIADGNSLLLRGEASVLKKFKKIIIDLDTANVSLTVSIYRGVDPNILKEARGVKIHTTNRGSNSLDTITVEDGQRLVINERRLLVVPVESFGSTFSSGSNSGSSNSVGDRLNTPLSNRQSSSLLERSEIVSIENSLFIEPSLLSNKITSNKSDLSSEMQKVFIRYSVPIKEDNFTKGNNAQQERVLSTQKHIMSERIIEIDEWLQLSGHKVIAHRPSLTANKKVYATYKKTDTDNNIWIKVNRLQ